MSEVFKLTWYMAPVASQRPKHILRQFKNSISVTTWFVKQKYLDWDICSVLNGSKLKRESFNSLSYSVIAMSRIRKISQFFVDCQQCSDARKKVLHKLYHDLITYWSCETRLLLDMKQWLSSQDRWFFRPGSHHCFALSNQSLTHSMTSIGNVCL